jgi:sialic acid synthase SpsE
MMYAELGVGAIQIECHVTLDRRRARTDFSISELEAAGRPGKRDVE